MSRALARGVSLFNAGRYAEAARALARVPGARPLLRQALRFSGAEPEGFPALLKVGRFEDAFRAADRALAEDPSPETVEETMDGLELPGAARQPFFQPAFLRRLGRLSGPWPRFLRAYAFYRTDRHRDALRETAGFGRLGPRYGWMRYLRGKVLLHGLAEHRAARREFEAALRAMPSLWPAKAYWAEATLCLGDRTAAFAAFDSLVGSLRGSARAQALAWRGEARLWSGEWEMAERDCDRAARAGSLFALCWRGAARMKRGRLREAEKDLRAALAHHPDDAEALTWLGELLWRTGRSEESEKLLARAISLEKDPVWALAVRKKDDRLLSLSGVRRSHRYLRPLWPAGTPFRR